MNESNYAVRSGIPVGEAPAIIRTGAPPSVSLPQGAVEYICAPVGVTLTHALRRQNARMF